MYKEVAGLLDNIGYEFDKHKLEMCLIRSEKKKLIRTLILHSKNIDFDLWTNKNKAVVAAIAAMPDITIEAAKEKLDVAVNCNREASSREDVFMAAIRYTEEFNMVLELIGDAPLRRFLG